MHLQTSFEVAGEGISKVVFRKACSHVLTHTTAIRAYMILSRLTEDYTEAGAFRGILWAVILLTGICLDWRIGGFNGGYHDNLALSGLRQWWQLL